MNTLKYDFSHMIEDPLDNLPNSAIRSIPICEGELLFHQGAPSVGLYRVKRGCVTLRRTTISGDTLTLYRALPGDLFAEASIFSEQYHCDAICVVPGEVQLISKKEVLEQLSNNKDFALSFSALLARQVQDYRFLLEILAIKSAEERVLAAVSVGYLNGTVLDFATRIQLTHETCYRMLRSLCLKGRLVQKGRGRYQLLETSEEASESTANSSLAEPGLR